MNYEQSSRFQHTRSNDVPKCGVIRDRDIRIHFLDMLRRDDVGNNANRKGSRPHRVAVRRVDSDHGAGHVFGATTKRDRRRLAERAQLEADRVGRCARLSPNPPPPPSPYAPLRRQGEPLPALLE